MVTGEGCGAGAGGSGGSCRVSGIAKAQTLEQLLVSSSESLGVCAEVRFATIMWAKVVCWPSTRAAEGGVGVVEE